MKRILLATLFTLVTACQPGESEGLRAPVAITGLRGEYVADERIEFTLKNVSPNRLHYWVTVERSSDAEWFPLYSSLEGMRDIMSEPMLSGLDTGASRVIHWRPTDDQTFLRSKGSGVGEYRFVVRWESGNAAAQQMISQTFRVASPLSR